MLTFATVGSIQTSPLLDFALERLDRLHTIFFWELELGQRTGSRQGRFSEFIDQFRAQSTLRSANRQTAAGTATHRETLLQALSKIRGTWPVSRLPSPTAFVFCGCSIEGRMAAAALNHGLPAQLLGEEYSAD